MNPPLSVRIPPRARVRGNLVACSRHFLPVFLAVKSGFSMQSATTTVGPRVTSTIYIAIF